MLVEKMNDLAFRFVEDNIVMNARSLYNYFIQNEGTKSEFDYFLMFVKHWMDNKQALRWADIIFESDPSGGSDSYIYRNSCREKF